MTVSEMTTTTSLGTTSIAAPEPVSARVVLVDDHELLAHSAAYALRAHGVDAHVVPVSTYDGIVADVVAIDPQVVLLDLHLGTLGLSIPLISRLTAAGIDVVIVTGETDRASWGACVEAGSITPSSHSRALA
jgi:two-component system nitrate/nitrite response regulator NarL